MNTEIYSKFNKLNIAPYSAEKIIIKNSRGKIVGRIPIDNFKPKYGKRLYRFGVLSDVHFNDENNDTNNDNGYTWNEDSTKDFERALKFLNDKESVEFTCICGDITTNDGKFGNIESLADYKNSIEKYSPNTPVYTCTGNHDTSKSYDWDDISNPNVSTQIWKEYTGMESRNVHKQFEHDGIKDNFIFFSMHRFDLGSQGNIFTEDDIIWLTNILEEHKNERSFIFLHTPFPYRSGLAGHRYNDGAYWLGGKRLKQLTELSYKYQNTIWFSGHSHYEWNCQGEYTSSVSDNSNNNVYNFKEYNYDANVYPVEQYPRTVGWCVHIPSCAGVRPLNYAKKLTNSWKVYNTSEFAIIDVYENYIDVRGISLVGQDRENEGKLVYNPIATYRLDTTPSNNKPYDLTLLKEDDFNNMEIGETKTICFTSVAYDNRHFGIKNGFWRNAYINNSFSDQELSVNIRGTNANNNEEIHKNNEAQLFSEMKDLVNEKYNQFTFTLEKVEGGFKLKNNEFYICNIRGNLIPLTDDESNIINIVKNTSSRIASSTLVKQTGNEYLLKMKIGDSYVRMTDYPTLQENADDGWNLIYIYEVSK